MTRYFLPALAIALCATSPGSAQSAPNCAPRDVVLAGLADTYGETRQAVGLCANDAVVEVFASQTSGSWSITVTAPNGVTCLVASGMAFENVTETLPARGDDA